MEGITFPTLVNNAYLRGIIKENDVGSVENILALAFPKHYGGELSSENMFVGSFMLQYASAYQVSMQLSDNIALLLIEYIASRVQLMDFLDLFLTSSRYLGVCDQTRIDEEIIAAFGYAELYDDDLAAKIEAMDEDAFMAYCHYIVDLAIKASREVRENMASETDVEYDTRIAIPIIRYIYNHTLIPRAMTLAYLEMNLTY